MLPIIKGVLKNTGFSRAVSSLSRGIEQYVVREALPAEYLSVSKLRAPESNKDARASDKFDEADLFDSDLDNLATSCLRPDYFCFVAVPEVKKVEKCDKYIEDVVHGSVDLLLSVDPIEAHYGLVSPLWMGPTTDPNKDACITNLVVAPGMRRRGVGQTLLRHALDRAREEGMLQVFVSMDKENKGVVELNKRVGFQVLVDDENARDLVMGIKL